MRLKISLVGVHKKEDFIFLWVERKTPLLRPTLQSHLVFHCGLAITVTEEEET